MSVIMLIFFWLLLNACLCVSLTEIVEMGRGGGGEGHGMAIELGLLRTQYKWHPIMESPNLVVMVMHLSPSNHTKRVNQIRKVVIVSNSWQLQVRVMLTVCV